MHRLALKSFSGSLLLLALAACNGKEPGKGDTGPAGDGGDTDYECDPDVDYDCDGFVDDDCEPNNATAYPGARELPYDGLDNDCAGDGDLRDVDEDGFESTAVGGDDCNDTNPDINPDGTELTRDNCYNDVDDDCDGVIDDGDPEINDCDGDGWEPTTDGDCNDQDPAVNPDAEEIWYDGLDQNCSGPTEDDYDQDGDGDPIEGHDDGTDCDDTDPLTGADFPELLDDVDRDCDGLLNSIPIRDAAYDFYGTIGTGEGWFGSSIVPLDDYDGDGQRDFGVGAPFSDVDAELCDKSLTDGTFNVSPCGGWFLVLPTSAGTGAPSGRYLTRVVGNTGASAESTGDWLGFGAANLGDMDGDGWSEVAVGAPSRGSGTVLLFEGSSFLGGGEITDDDALTTLNGTAYNGGQIAALRDVNGDGKNELAATSFGGVVGLYAGVSLTLDVIIWNGADAAAGGTLLGSDNLARMDGTGVGGEIIGGADFNADGLGDLLLGTDVDSRGTLVFWDGADIAAGGDFTAADHATVQGGTGAALGLTLGWLADLDGDGYPEAAAAAPYAEGDEEGSGVVYIIDGDTLVSSTGSVSSAAMATINGSIYYGLMEVTAAEPGDVDVDGYSDLVTADLGGTDANQIKGEVRVWAGSALRSGGTFSAGDAMAVLPTNNDDDIFGATGILWDIEGDGDSDLGLTAPFRSDVGMAGVFLSNYAD